MSDGWIKLHRKSLESRVFSDAALWRLWTWCLLKANHAPGFFCGEEISRGSFATGTRAAGEALGLSPSTVYRGLKKLAEWSMVELKVKRGFTVVTVCNYETYQDSESDGETEMKQTCNAGETQMKTNKNNNNNKNLPPSPPPATQGGDSPRSAAWMGVEEDLLKCGVSAAGKAVDAAISNGCRSDDVIAVVAFWRCSRPKWGAGALYQRILNLRPGQDHSELWPDPSKEFQATEARAASVKSHATLTTERLALEKRRQEDREAREDRERLHGATLDAMSREQVLSIIKEHYADSATLMIRRMPAAGKMTGAVRDELLIHLDQVAGVSR